MAKPKKPTGPATARQLINAELAKTTSPHVRRVLLRIRRKLPAEKLGRMSALYENVRFKKAFAVRYSPVRFKFKKLGGFAKAKVARKGGTGSTGPRITRSYK